MSAGRRVEILLHPDPLRLETELAERVRDAKARSAPWARVLVLAPTRRLVARLRASLAESAGALVGVDVLHYQALARDLASREGAFRLASRRLAEALVERALAAHPKLPLAAHASGRPAAVAELGERFTELREAGIEPAGLGASAEVSTAARDLSLLYREYVSLLAALEREPAWTDRAGLTRRAAIAAAALPPYQGIIAYGAYEIVGMNLALLRSLPSRAPPVLLVPADPERPAYRHARRSIARLFSTEPRGLDDTAAVRPFVAAARSLWDREHPPAPLPRSRVRLVHAQGPEAELNHAARRALRLVSRGIPPESIAVVARSLEPYAGVAESVFARHGLPVDTSLRYPLSRHPLARALLLFLEVWKSDFGRREVIELARSPHLADGPAPRTGGPRRPEDWDRWSRTFGIVRGARAWTDDLPALVRSQDPPPWDREDPHAAARFAARVAEDAASADALGTLVAAWRREREALAAEGGAGDRAAFLRDLPARWILGWGDPAVDGAREVAAAWEGILEELPPLERTAGPLTAESACAHAARALVEAETPAGRSGGIAFIDAMQARGLVFRHLILIGFNEGLLPRRVRENPSLPDAVRERLRERTGAPIAVRAEGREEEWLLFAGLVASAVKSLTVTWQRADADGKALGPSLFLRELVRVLPGSPSLAGLLEGTETVVPDAVPTHPARAAAWLRARTGLLTVEEGALLDAALARGDETAAVRRFLEGVAPPRKEGLEPGLRLIEAIERYESPHLPYDAVLDADPGWTQAFSATSLERLAGCPLKFFFRDVLRVRPLDEEDHELRPGARELGNRVHRLLEHVFRELDDRGLLVSGAPEDEAAAAAAATVTGGWDEAFAPVRRRLGPRYPLLLRSVETIWRSEIEAYLGFEIRRLREGGHRVLAVEAVWEGTVPLGDPDAGTPAPSPGFPVRGIPDRVTRDREGRLLVSDYKTGGKLENRVEEAEILSARRSQLPLYVLLAGIHALAGEGIEAEFLGIGPAYLPDRGAARSGPVTLTGDVLDETRDGFRETLGVLGDLVRHGRFPFRSGRHCDWCEFRRACRRRHHASRQRVESRADLVPYFLTQKKTKTKRMIADVSPDGEDDA
jgi:RecB family exonuclease